MSKVPDSRENADKCVCPDCPTFQASECPREKKETLYCAHGKSTCGLENQGCICGMCPLWDEYRLSGGTFCVKGIVD